MRSSVSVLWRLLRLGGHPALAGGLVLSAVLRTARDLATLVTLANATNCLIYGGDFAASLIWMAAAMFAGTPIYALNQYCLERYRLGLRSGLTRKLSERLERAELTWLEERPSGSLLSACTADLEKWIRWASFSMPEMIRVLLYTATALGYCLSQNRFLTVCIVPVIVAVVPLVSKVSGPLERLTGRQRKMAAESLHKTQEALRDMELIKAYGLEQDMEARVAVALEERRGLEESGAVFFGLTEALAYLAGYLPGFIAAGAGSLFLMRGELSAGFLVGFVQIAVQRFGELAPKMGQMVTGTRQAVVSGTLLLEILNAPVQGSGTVRAMRGDRVLELNHVSFGYDPDHPVLRDVSLRADRGEMIAVVGGSGCGKTTLFKLLMGVYRQYQGEILVGGSSVREWDPEALQSQIAPVFQQPYLFPFTLLENLWTREQPADEEEIWTALRQACAGKLEEELPEGLRTELGEQGAGLSGGQMQRITLARAFLKDAPLIIMDEPTSALDSVTESGFWQAFDRLRKGHTSLVAAHRLAAVRNADRIYVLEGGTVAQCGTHEELMAAEGPYRALYESQERAGKGEAI